MRKVLLEADFVVTSGLRRWPAESPLAIRQTAKYQDASGVAAPGVLPVKRDGLQYHFQTVDQFAVDGAMMGLGRGLEAVVEIVGYVLEGDGSHDQAASSDMEPL